MRVTASAQLRGSDAHNCGNGFVDAVRKPMSSKTPMLRLTGDGPHGCRRCPHTAGPGVARIRL